VREAFLTDCRASLRDHQSLTA